MATTSNDYLKAIKGQYEMEKGKTYSSFLMDPSPAKLRDYCLLLLASGMSNIDQSQMANFFKPKAGETLHKCISGFDTEKLKPIKDFLTGKTQQTNSVNLELIAILVHYQPRPYNKFLNNPQLEKADVKKDEEFFDSPEDDGRSNQSDTDTGTFVSTEKGPKRKVIMIALAIVAFLSVGYIAKGTYFPTKSCMQWQEDHYEIVACEVNGLAMICPVLALDEDVVDLKKVQLKKGMQFFKYKKPLYYYYKVSQDSVEFFNAPGLHPITNEPLKKITWHMIDKYVK